MIDTKAILERVNLLALIESDLGPGRKSGRWVLFSCPFAGHRNGDKKPSLAVTPDNGRWHCFSCGRSGDAIRWLQEREGLPFLEACERLAAGSGNLVQAPTRPVPVESPSSPPAEAWQREALAFVADSVRALWQPEGARALEYLRNKRGLSDRTIHFWRLGYNPQTLRPVSWGGVADENLYIPRGIVMPGMVDGACWYVKIRQPTGEPKYLNIRGGFPCLFGADSLTGADIVLLLEGEFDTMLAWQELGDLCGVATLGSATKTLNLATWGRYLLPARMILAAYDTDAAGNRGTAKLAALTQRAHTVPVPRIQPNDKDITDYWRSGGNLQAWLLHHLKRIDPAPTLESWAASVGATVNLAPGRALLDRAEAAEAAGNLDAFTWYFALGMVCIDDDIQKWAAWAAENGQRLPPAVSAV